MSSLVALPVFVWLGGDATSCTSSVSLGPAWAIVITLCLLSKDVIHSTLVCHQLTTHDVGSEKLGVCEGSLAIVFVQLCSHCHALRATRHYHPNPKHRKPSKLERCRHHHRQHQKEEEEGAAEAREAMAPSIDSASWCLPPSGQSLSLACLSLELGLSASASLPCLNQLQQPRRQRQPSLQSEL